MPPGLVIRRIRARDHPGQAGGRGIRLPPIGYRINLYAIKASSHREIARC